MDKAVSEYMPKMLFGKTLLDKLAVYPQYDGKIRNKDTAERLIALQDIYKIYVPNQMAVEIYSKMYLSLLRSLQKKQSIDAVVQANENYKMVRQQSYESIIGGSDSFTIIGESGIGKSSAVSRAMRLIANEPYITVNDTKIILCLQVQAPADASVKGLLLEILRKVDEILDTNYYQYSIRGKATADTLIGTVSQVALNHIGLLIIDEVQNIVNSKNGKNVIGALTQFINNSGVSICMVGTNETAAFFEQAMMLARRSLGLQYSQMEYGNEFCFFCNCLLRYCYTKECADVGEEMYRWMYLHSQGNASVVVSLIHSAQEIAILNGTDVLDMSALQSAYEKRLRMLHMYINPTQNIGLPTATSEKIVIRESKMVNDETKIADAVKEAKGLGVSIIDSLRHRDFSVEEIAI